MELLPLPLFPQGSLASSVITTVWIGVAVVAFFNLRFGWVLSGLVVPGYMVPLIIIKPWAAVVIIIESIVTYFMVWLFSERLSRLGYWSQVFGRDRFFALILMSVLVRILFDGWLLPGLGEWMVERFEIPFDYRNNLHSFGLIIIALVANQFWKSGLRKGVLPLFGNLAVTYLIIRYGLMEITNFSVSNLNYMYEDIASSILASPKAYIILITTAFVASRMNLLYGWDFSGIMIPSLLALQWYQPSKILASFFEALLILGIAHLLMRTALFRNTSLEGGRKLLLFFNIGFIYKLLLGYLILWLAPEVKVTDTYAFGYLLATLMAMKMHDKDIAARLTRATLQTSLVGVVVASVIGFTLTLLPGTDIGVGTEARAAIASQLIESETSIMDRLREDRVRLYQPQSNQQMPLPLAGELERFSEGLQRLRDYLANPDERLLETALNKLHQVGYQVLHHDGGYYYLREKGPVRGWGLYVLRSAPKSRLTVEVPAPLDERGAMDAGLQIFEQLGARGLAIAGASRELHPDRSADVLTNPQSFFQLFHSVIAKRDALQVRRYTKETSRLSAAIGFGDELDQAEPENALWVHVNLPPGLDLTALKTLAGSLRIQWKDAPFGNRQREISRSGFAELLLNQQGVRSVRSHAIGLGKAPPLTVGSQRIDGFLQDWLLARKGRIAAQGSNQYVSPKVEELLFFDAEVLTPLLEALAEAYRQGDWTPAGLEALRSIQAAASVLNYQLIRYRHKSTHEDFLILAEAETGDRRFWGSYVFRLSNSQNYLVQVPRPLYEVSSFEYGVSLFQRLRAKALLLAGAHPGANTDGSADIIRLDNVVNLFSLVNQVVLREAGDAPMLVIHSRALSRRGRGALSQADALISRIEAPSSQRVTEALVDPVLDQLAMEGVSYRFVEGEQDTAGYEIASVAQSLYINATRNKGFVALWLSPSARSVYRQQGRNRQEQLRFDALGIETREADLYEYLQALGSAGTATSTPLALRQRLIAYLGNRDVVALSGLRREWPDFNWQRLIDLNSRQSFLIGLDKAARLSLVANLNPRQADAVSSAGRPLSRSRVQGFIDSRKALLDLEGGQ
ncbi:MAG: poly-gamma-glutamate biosynthesis protein PgsC/CapC [Candidatus Thiodiazotropha sp. (ex Dulcina madagascariensis)]|nr:poly-gamma-glutamate biosynthesis protein PgsC/CapC [Candidatus Thiodiazotropha sp. (ex Dulcina madagascariensis)]